MRRTHFARLKASCHFVCSSCHTCKRMVLARGLVVLNFYSSHHCRSWHSTFEFVASSPESFHWIHGSRSSSLAGDTRRTPFSSPTPPRCFLSTNCRRQRMSSPQSLSATKQSSRQANRQTGYQAIQSTRQQASEQPAKQKLNASLLARCAYFRPHVRALAQTSSLAGASSGGNVGFGALKFTVLCVLLRIKDQKE